MTLTEDFSGVVINQNQVPQPVSSGLAFYEMSDAWLYQEFFLPPDYQRGTDANEARLPELSGLQVLVQVDTFQPKAAGFDYQLQYFDFSTGWVTLAKGVCVGAPDNGQVWMTAFFSDPVPINATVANSRMRFGVRGRDVAEGTIDLPVDYVNGIANVEGIGVEVIIDEDRPTPHVVKGVPSVFYIVDGQAFYSVQQGVSLWYASVPNPLAGYGFVRAYGEDGTTPLKLLNNDFSFNFRILGLVADEGIDFLGNRYRSVVVRNQTEDITTVNVGDSAGSYWMSRPYPSKFAVESLYFDVTTNGDASVIDQVLLDPITPGVFFNIYFSSEGPVPTREADWENKLWERIPVIYRMNSRETHTLPAPITTKYIKIEFSHLKAQYYAPGNFQQPIQYKKHPKWVLDYFLARLATEDLISNAGRVTVVYDLLDLAYNYYLDDLGPRQEELTSNSLNISSLTDFLSERGDFSDQVDPITLGLINTQMNAFRQHPVYRANMDSLMGQDALNSIDPREDYQTERPLNFSLSTTDVSSVNRESLIVEQAMPVMFFYLRSRHKYRELQAAFEYDRAYFVGIREMAFLRNSYMVDSDSEMYVETNGDLFNSARNDFIKPIDKSLFTGEDVIVSEETYPNG